MSNSNQKKEMQNKAQDYVTNKLLCAFTIAFIMIIAVMTLSRGMHDIYTLVDSMQRVKTVAIILLALTVVFAVIAIINKIRQKDEQYRLVTAKHIAVVLGFATVCFGLLAFSFQPSTVNLLYVFIPAVTVLFIIYNSFPRDFFVLSFVAGVGAIAVWLLGLSGGIPVIAGMLAIIVAATVLTIVSHVRKKKFWLIPGDAKYVLLYVTYALVAALVIAAWFFAGFSYYMVFALLAYIVLTGIYYAVKML